MRVLLGMLVVILVVLQFNLWVGEGSYSQQLDLEAQVEMQKEENVTLAERNLELENEVLDLKTGLDAVEERARSEFGMVKKDETLYLIVE
ncbi:MAG: septum formation initiator family protein [Pseudohongiellaceae bacterium]|nr:MAG: cell division protein FtsB [Gammaproteobacteria bacterium RIFCSPLOWO2_02_FULL_57_10]